jgi:hypothetical protein
VIRLHRRFSNDPIKIHLAGPAPTDYFDPAEANHILSEWMELWHVQNGQSHRLCEGGKLQTKIIQDDWSHFITDTRTLFRVFVCNCKTLVPFKQSRGGGNCCPMCRWTRAFWARPSTQKSKYIFHPPKDHPLTLYMRLAPATDERYVAPLIYSCVHCGLHSGLITRPDLCQPGLFCRPVHFWCQSKGA